MPWLCTKIFLYTGFAIRGLYNKNTTYLRIYGIFVLLLPFDKSVELDLLSDKLVIKKEIAKLNSKSKGLIPSAAFKAIISAYEEIKDEIEKSPSVA